MATQAPKTKSQPGRKKTVPASSLPAAPAAASNAHYAPSPSVTGDSMVRTGVAITLIGVSHTTFNRLVHDGELLPCQRTPGGQALFRYSDVMAFIKQTNARFADRSGLPKPTPEAALPDDDGSAL